MQKAAVIAVFSALTAALFFFGNASGAEMTVVRTQKGFVPRDIVINKGETVSFENQTGGDMWPASDFHPTHGLYPDFDAKGAVPKGRAWSFTFDKAGVWNYHDHLHPETRGLVVVRGEPGESARECRMHIAASSTDVALCYEADIVDAIEQGGLDRAFKKIDEFFSEDPAFAQNCHDVMHVLGAEAYRAYASDKNVVYRPETSYCGWGFYHGFIEKMLSEKGGGAYATVRSYCDDLERRPFSFNFSGACYHGIGHATFDSLDSSLWGDPRKMVSAALSLCEQILPDMRGRVSCSSGVFNSLANAMSAHSYGLFFNGPQDLDLCKDQQDQYRTGCYTELQIHFFDDHSREADIALIRSYPSEVQLSAFSALATSLAKRAGSDISPEEFDRWCSSFSDPSWRDGCVSGALSGRMRTAKPGEEFAAALAFCLPIRDPLRRTCYSTAFAQLRQIAHDIDEFRGWCRDIEEQDIRNYCEKEIPWSGVK